MFKSVLWDGLKEIRDILPFSKVDKFDELIDKTFIPELAENGDEIVKLAMAMFLGKEGDVVQMSSGGGGGSSSGWRKKDDEDEDAYRYRCFGMAASFIRYKQKRSIGRR